MYTEQSQDTQQEDFSHVVIPIAEALVKAIDFEKTRPVLIRTVVEFDECIFTILDLVMRTDDDFTFVLFAREMKSEEGKKIVLKVYIQGNEIKILCKDGQKPVLNAACALDIPYYIDILKQYLLGRTLTEVED